MMRSRLPSDLLLVPDGGVELAAIAELWKRTHRTFLARFDGVSMRPTIEPQQSVTVRCGQEPALGDVVLALAGNGVVVHRLVWRSRRGDWVLTRGDSRAIPDLPLDPNDIAAVIDAPPFAERATQRIALRIVVAAGRVGRGFAALAVRALQIVWWSRSGWSGRI
jgi:peptidase S24-like protein